MFMIVWIRVGFFIFIRNSKKGIVWETIGGVVKILWASFILELNLIRI